MTNTDALKRQLKDVISVAEKATPGPWETATNGDCLLSVFSDPEKKCICKPQTIFYDEKGNRHDEPKTVYSKDADDFTHISNNSPDQVIKRTQALLLALEGLEWILAGEEGRANIDVKNMSKHTLSKIQAILEEKK